MITDNYIKMCEKAEEIQESRPFLEKGDYFYNVRACLGEISMTENSVLERLKGCPIIWLPTQEQLQEMLEEIKNNTYIAFRFNHFLNVEYNNVTFQPAYILLNSINPIFMCSMNEFWLAFVMKERWNKVWDGENWVKEVRE